MLLKGAEEHHEVPASEKVTIIGVLKTKIAMAIRIFLDLLSL
jgi:hypothetical protein